MWKEIYIFSLTEILDRDCGKQSKLSMWKEIYDFSSTEIQDRNCEYHIIYQRNSGDRCGQTKKTERVEGNIYFH